MWRTKNINSSNCESIKGHAFRNVGGIRNPDNQLTVGAVDPIFGIFLRVRVLLESVYFIFEFGYFWNQFTSYSVYTSKYLSLACLPNLFWFYFFLNRERWARARGVIFSVLVLVPYAIYVNF